MAHQDRATCKSRATPRSGVTHSPATTLRPACPGLGRNGRRFLSLVGESRRSSGRASHTGRMVHDAPDHATVRDEAHDAHLASASRTH
jgi:hypothetical protein